MIRTEAVEELIRERFENAIANFNFYKVLIVMDALHWGWASTGGKVPNTFEMEDCVRGLFDGALEDWLKEREKARVYHATGGFEVAIGDDKSVEISFIAEEAVSYNE